MSTFRKVAMVLMALVIMLSAMGLTAQPAQASGCRTYHWVRYGETLAWIGRYYGVSWPYLASVNGIGRPYTIYAGQRLCIPTGGYYGGSYGGYPTYTGGYTSAVGAQRTWSYVITDVDPNTTVNIRTNNFPSNVEFRVKMGNNVNGHYNGEIYHRWTRVMVELSAPILPYRLSSRAPISWLYGSSSTRRTAKPSPRIRSSTMLLVAMVVYRPILRRFIQPPAMDTRPAGVSFRRSGFRVLCEIIR